MLCMLAASCAFPQNPGSNSIGEPDQPSGSDRSGDERAGELLDILLEEEFQTTSEAVDQLTAAQDTRFCAVFIELLRASEIGLVHPVNRPAYLQALGDLCGQSFGEDWSAWVEWYGMTDLQPPPGFTSWKGRLLSRIDVRFGDFFKDELPSNLRVEEILWGGVAVDGIPALDNLATIPASQADYLAGEEPVFGIALNGAARAYPLRILDWHEMANDVLGGIPLSLAYCTLCGAGIAYQATISIGEGLPAPGVLTFGSSGLLFRSNKLMYDRQTNTLWNQLTGQPVMGELADAGLQLELLPVVLTRWADWRQQHPETSVLDLTTGYSRFYEPGAAYASYFASPETMFPVWQRSEILETKERVFALYLDGSAKAYPLEKLVQEQVVNDVLGGTALVIIARCGTVSVSGSDLRHMNLFAGPERENRVTYESGGEVRAFSRGQRMFRPGPQADQLIDERGQTWTIGEQAISGPNGESEPRLPGHLAYWFGWYAFFPDTLVYGYPQEAHTK